MMEIFRPFLRTLNSNAEFKHIRSFERQFNFVKILKFCKYLHLYLCCVIFCSKFHSNCARQVLSYKRVHLHSDSCLQHSTIFTFCRPQILSGGCLQRIYRRERNGDHFLTRSLQICVFIYYVLCIHVYDCLLSDFGPEAHKATIVELDGCNIYILVHQLASKNCKRLKEVKNLHIFCNNRISILHRSGYR